QRYQWRHSPGRAAPALGPARTRTCPKGRRSREKNVADGRNPCFGLCSARLDGSRVRRHAPCAKDSAFPAPAPPSGAWRGSSVLGPKKNARHLFALTNTKRMEERHEGLI